MNLLIIRHGESEADLMNVCEGRADFSLTERGCRQAESMAKYLNQNYRITHIYTSALKRAVQTAYYLAQQTGITVIEEPLLMEFNNGLIAGMDKNEAMERYPIVSNVPLHDSVYGQESKLNFRFRADYILSKIISESHEDDVIAVITHGGMINQLYHSFLRLPVDSDILIRTGDTGIHEWRIEASKRVIIMANHTAHLNSL